MVPSGVAGMRNDVPVQPEIEVGDDGTEAEPRRRVLMVITSGLVGGGQQHVADICAELRQDYDILVVCGQCQDGDYLPEALKPLGVAWEQIPDLVRPINPRHDWRALTALRTIVRRFRPDVIHAHTAKAGALVRLVRPFAGRDTRIVYTPHNWAFNNPNNAGSARVNLWIERGLAWLTHATVMVSEAEMKLALKKRVGRRSRMHVIYSGRALPELLPPQEHPPEAVFRLTWVGRLEGHKDPDTVIEAVRLLPADVRAQFELVVVGSGAAAARIEAMSADLPVRMVGARDNVTALAWMASGNAFVLSSRYEPFGLVVLEAMGLGIPVIASAEGGPSEIIEDGVSGLLFPQGDAHALRDAILRLMGDAELYGRLRENGLRRFKDFSTGRAADGLRKLYAA